MVATFHLNCLGPRIKYGNPEVENTRQQFLSTTPPSCSIESIESFLFWFISITYNTGIYICIYIYKVSYIHSSFVCNVFLNILRYEKILKLTSRLLYSTIHHVMWYLWVFIVNPFSLLCSIFFSQENCVSFGLLSFSLSLTQSVSQYFW